METDKHIVKYGGKLSVPGGFAAATENTASIRRLLRRRHYSVYEETDQKMGAVPAQSTSAAVLWAGLDDYKRVVLCDVRTGNLAEYTLDDRGGGGISHLPVAAGFAGENRYRGNCNRAAAPVVPQRPEDPGGLAGTAR